MAEAVGPDELRVEVMAGENVQVTPTVREALDNLARALNEEIEAQSEVAGFAYQPGLQVGGLSRSGGIATGTAGSDAMGTAAGCNTLCIIRITCKLSGLPGI